MKATLKDNSITIVLPIAPSISKSGKSNVIATTNGFAISEAVFEGKPVKISVNVIVPIK
jgi:hypothetical protein